MIRRIALVIGILLALACYTLLVLEFAGKRPWGPDPAAENQHPTEHPSLSSQVSHVDPDLGRTDSTDGNHASLEHSSGTGDVFSPFSSVQPEEVLGIHQRACPRSPLESMVGPANRQKEWTPWEREKCSCPENLAVQSQLGLPDLPAKVCAFTIQGLKPIVMFSQDQEASSYTAYEMDSKTYGLFSEIARPGSVIVDIGANLGFFSIPVAVAVPGSRVFSYELNPGTFSMLQRNVYANGLESRVRVRNQGLSADGQPIKLPRCLATTRGGTAMVSAFSLKCYSQGCKTFLNSMKQCSKGPHVSVPSTTFSAIMDDLAELGIFKIDLLKIDCEGCEHGVLPMIPENGLVDRIVGECHVTEKTTPEEKKECKRRVKKTTVKR